MKLVFTIVFFYSLTIYAQSQRLYDFSYKEPNAFVSNEMLYETKDHYISIGYYDPFNKIGVHVYKYDKKNGDLVHKDVFYFKNYWLFVAGRTKIYDIDEKLVFAVSGKGHIFKLAFDYKHDHLLTLDTIQSPLGQGLYVQDMEISGDSTIYHANIGDSLCWIIRHPDKKLEFVYIKDQEPRNECSHFIKGENANYIFFGGKNDIQKNRRRIAVTEIDKNGNKIWERENTNNASFSVETIVPINNNHILILTVSKGNDPFTNKSGFFHSLYRYNLSTKTFTFLRDYSLPSTLLGPYGDLVRSVNDSSSYFVCTGSPITNTETNKNFLAGRICKIKENGVPIWTKDYYKLSEHQDRNRFHAIIPTSDRNYLIGGELTGKFVAGWLVKIDEDGNILPIDTTSATTDPYIHNTIPEIKIYPNPASHSIIINQGEITDMMYQLTDMNGAVLKTIPLPHAHHHVVWDISDVASGTYVLTMLQGGKVIGSRQQVVVH